MMVCRCGIICGIVRESILWALFNQTSVHKVLMTYLAACSCLHCSHHHNVFWEPTQTTDFLPSSSAYSLKQSLAASLLLPWYQGNASCSKVESYKSFWTLICWGQFHNLIRAAVNDGEWVRPEALGCRKRSVTCMYFGWFSFPTIQSRNGTGKLKGILLIIRG